jgi:hypothetical protein
MRNKDVSECHSTCCPLSALPATYKRRFCERAEVADAVRRWARQPALHLLQVANWLRKGVLPCPSLLVAKESEVRESFPFNASISSRRPRGPSELRERFRKRLRACTHTRASICENGEGYIRGVMPSAARLICRCSHPRCRRTEGRDQRDPAHGAPEQAPRKTPSRRSR